MDVFLAGEMEMTRLPPYEGADGSAVTPVQYTEVIKRRLYSYWYHNDKGGSLSKTVRESVALGHDLFLDSGAFSAFTQGDEVLLPQYIKFVQKHGHNYRLRASLDVLGDDGPKSWANLKAMESEGCEVFPTFHFGDDTKYLSKILDEGYKYMALGGLVGASTKALQEWLDPIWGNYLTDNRGKARLNVHGFGLTSFPLMYRYPWASVDSSSWIMTSNFGGCSFVIDGEFFNIDFSKDSTSKRNANSWHYETMPGPMRAKIDAQLTRFRITPELLGGHYSYRRIINAAAFLDMESLPHTSTFFLPQESLF